MGRCVRKRLKRNDVTPYLRRRSPFEIFAFPILTLYPPCYGVAVSTAWLPKFRQLTREQQIAFLQGLSPEERDMVTNIAVTQLKDAWCPLPGPQTAAYESKADELFYGGAQGGGKCLTPDHEVMVKRRGWVGIAFVVPGEQVLSWQDGNLVWAEVQAVHGYRFTGKLRTYKGRWSFRATPNHKWRVRWETETQKIGRSQGPNRRSCKWRWADATELRPNMKIPCGGAGVIGHEMAYSEAELELWGWWLAEGSGFTPGGMARFSQVKEVGRKRLVYLAQVLGRHYTTPAREVRIAWTPPLPCGTDCYNKFIPRELMSEVDRKHLLAGFLGGDGYMRRKGWEYSSSSWELANGVHELATLQGLRATINPKKVQSGNPHWVVRAYPRTEWSISPEKGALGWEDYDGPVHCLTVDAGVFCVRHGGGVHVTGNSDLILGVAKNLHHWSIIFRREFPLHRTLIERSREIYNAVRTDHLHDRYNESLHRWAFADGQMIEFGAMEHEADKENWRGRPHDLYCVGKGTPILLANGMYKSVENVQCGDEVATLQGGCKVTRTIKQGVKHCWRVTVDGVATIISDHHKILTVYGWLSPLELQSRQSRAACSMPEALSVSSSGCDTPSGFQLSDHGRASWQEQRSRQGMQLQGSDASSGDAGTDCEGSYDGRQESRPPVRLSVPVVLLEHAAHQGRQDSSGESAACGEVCVPTGLAAQDWQNDCRDGSRFYSDNRPRRWGDRGHTPSRIPAGKLRYHHPYTMAEEVASETVLVRVAEMVPVGEAEVYDLTISSACHYSSLGGIISKNCFDEVTQLTESQFRFVIAWCRTARPGQRCRVIATGNPPTSVEGEWILRYWGPWLDETYPRPAEPGELRWFARLNDKDIECKTGEPFEFTHKDGRKETVWPRSRTFIPARLEDNPILERKGYRAVLQSLPEPLRSQALYGDMRIGLTDDAWQVIPTAWMRAAQARWKASGGEPPEGQRMTSMGVDVAHGGCFDDQTEILTDSGWKRFDGLTGAERVLSLDGEIAKWGEITQIHRYWHDGEMNLYNGRKVNFCITDNHNLLVKTGPKSSVYTLRRFDELADQFVIKRTNQWEGKNAKKIVFRSSVRMPHGGTREQAWDFDMVDWAKLVGWFVSEGCAFKEKRRNGRYRVSIAQKPGAKLEMIRALLCKMKILHYSSGEPERGRGVSFSINSIGRHLIAHCGQHAKNKRIPVYIKEATTEVIEAFLETYCLGDGMIRKPTRNRRGGTRYYGSTSRGLIDDVQEVLAKLGRAGKVSEQQTAGTLANFDGRLVTRKQNTLSCGERANATDSEIRMKKVKRISYRGFVHCVSTPLKTIMVRRNGCAMWSGNSAQTVLQPRYGNWFAMPLKFPGAQTQTGPDVAALVVKHHEAGADINVDAQGYGASACEFLQSYSWLHATVRPINEESKTTLYDKTGRFKFGSLRSAMFWKLREALDPEQGDNLALPPDRELLADLCAARYEVKASGIQVEPKDKIKERTGRTLDCFVAGTPVLTGSGNRPVESIRAGQQVWTRAGLRRVVFAGETAVCHHTKLVVFSDGRFLRGSADHPVFVVGRGFIALDALCYGDRIVSWQDSRAKWSCLKGTATRAQHRLLTSSECESSHPHGTGARQEELGTANTESRPGLGERSTSKPVLSAVNGMQPLETSIASVGQLATRSTIEGTKRSSSLPSAQRAARTSFLPQARRRKRARQAAAHVIAVLDAQPAPIFNLTVEGQPEYFANGILVHNCGDACLYANWISIGGMVPSADAHAAADKEIAKTSNARWWENKPKAMAGGRRGMYGRGVEEED